MKGRSLLPSFLASLLVLVAGGALADAPPGPPRRPPASFDSRETPLQKALKRAHGENAGRKNQKCAEGNPKLCDSVGTLTADDLGGPKSINHPDGKPAGKRLVTKTTLHFKSAKQKRRAEEIEDPNFEDTWPSTKLKDIERLNEHIPGPVIPPPNGNARRNFGSGFIPDPGVNDDQDCVDMVTGEHRAGASCFDAEGHLLGTLTEMQYEVPRPGKPVETVPACQHEDGTVFFGDPADMEDDDCWDELNVLKTTLVETIDEDGGAAGEDDDGDGAIDEDGIEAATGDAQGLEEPAPATAEEAQCRRFYERAGLTFTAGDLDAEGHCTIDRALVKFVNDKSQSKGKGKFFDDEAGAGKVAPGKEEREIEITESFAVKCHPGTTFVETLTDADNDPSTPAEEGGVCVPDDEIEGADEGYVAALGVIAGPKSVALASEGAPDIAKVAMMGFTFAPPVLEWGWRVRERVCFLGICIEIFYARIGYEFDLAVGLRLPVEIEALNVDGDAITEETSVLATEDHYVETRLEPLDFTAEQFEQFCLEHHLDSDWFIGPGGGLTACERFGFMNFLDAMVPDTLLPPEKKDGDEFVARYSVFAGIQVRVLMIPIINWAIESGLDLPAACTMQRILEIDDPVLVGKIVLALLGFGDGDPNVLREALDLLKEEQIACGTFTTPFGYEEPGQIRAFPFAGEYKIPADCVQALIDGKVITINGQPRPICTNMILGVAGASLGVGLAIEVQFGSDLIRSSATNEEDVAILSQSAKVGWNPEPTDIDARASIHFRADNYDDADGHDVARIQLADFIYYLNLIQIALNANLEFGGILSFIPDIASFNLYTFQISLGEYGLPIPQHPGTEAVEIAIPVENYGLKVNLRPETTNAELLAGPDTLRVKPGEFGAFLADVRNIGSETGDFDGFEVLLSNRPQNEGGDLAFGIDPNTDQDCREIATTAWHRGSRWDGVSDDCYLFDGTLRSGVTELIDEDPPSSAPGLSVAQRDDDGDGWPDEDPPDVWATTPVDLGSRTVLDLAAYTWSAPPADPPAAGDSVRIGVSPFRHPLTRPGTYPVRVLADSREAKELWLSDATKQRDPSPNRNFRWDASDVSFVKIESFFEPQVVILPASEDGKPGESVVYTVEGTNGGNESDSMSVDLAFLDFNEADCTLTTLGSDPDCAWRAAQAFIPDAWTTAADLAPFFPDPQPPERLDPLGSDQDTFTIAVPREWAGMTDTTYEFVITTISQADPALPRATRTFTAQYTVLATKESMTRYIGLEIAELISTLEAAAAQGVSLGGLWPIATKPIQMNNDRALEAILAGDLDRASGIHATGTRLVGAFVKALDGRKDLPPALDADLHARAAALLADGTAAEASTVPSAP